MTTKKELEHITNIALLESDSARRWSAAWKRAAKANKARHLHDVIKYKLKYRTAVKERAEARAVARHFYRRAGMLEDALDAVAGTAVDAIEERDAARAQLANAAAKEVDAVQGRQECEEERDEYRDLYQQLDRHTHEHVGPELDSLRQRRRELEAVLREARRELAAIRVALNGYEDSDLASLAEVLVSQRRLLARAVAVLATAEGVDAYEMGQGKVIKLAQSILEESAA